MPTDQIIDFIADVDPSEQRFDRAAAFTFRPDVEGGFVIDQGGPTNYGVTQKVLDAYTTKHKLPYMDVRKMPSSLGRKISKEEFFDVNKLGQLPDIVSEVTFDYALNSGGHQAILDLQRVVGIPKEDQDGINGQQTLDAVYDYTSKHGEKKTASELIERRKILQKGLIEKYPEKHKGSENGWRNRNDNLKKHFDLAPKEKSVTVDILSSLNPFHTPEASADEIPSQDGIDFQPDQDTENDLQPAIDDGIDFKPDEESSNFARGLEKSARQIPQLAYGTTALVADSIDVLFGGRDDDGPAGKARDWAMRGYKQAEGKIQAKAKENDDVIVAWNKAKEGDLGAMVDWASFTSGYGLGQIGESMAVGLAGALAGSAVLTPGVGTVAGGVGGAAQKGLMKKLIFNKVKEQADNILLKSAGKLTSFQAEKLAVKQMAAAIGAGAVLSSQNLMMEAGSIYPEAVENLGKDLNGMDIARVWGSALAAGSVETASDVLGLGAVMGKLRIPGVGGRIAKGASGMAIGAGIEGGTETIQTGIERFGAQKPVLDEEGKREMINAAAAGALPGAFVGGTAGVLTSPTIDEASKHGKVVGIDAKTKLPIIDTSSKADLSLAQPASTQPVLPIEPDAAVNASGLPETSSGVQEPAKSGQSLETQAESQQTQKNGIVEGGQVVFNDIKEQLTKAGYPEDQAVANAKLWEARANAAAQEQGITPEQWYEKNGPQITKGEAAPSAQALSQDRSKQTAKFNGKDITVIERSVNATTEDMVLNPDKVKGIIGPAFIQDGKVYGGKFDLENNANHADVFIKNKLDQTKAKPGFLTNNNEFVYQYEEDVPVKTAAEQRSPYRDEPTRSGFKKGDPVSIVNSEDNFSGKISRLNSGVGGTMVEVTDTLGKKKNFPVSQLNKGIAEEQAAYGKPAKMFYSQLDRVIETKMPNAATPEMVRGLLSDKNGVKKEEYEWLGVEEFLEGKQKVTKAELQDFIRQNEDRLPRVETKVHSIDITPSMKKSVMEEGQALFERPEQYQNVKMRYFDGEGRMVREKQLNFLKNEKEVSRGKGIPDRGGEAGVAPAIDGRSLWKSPAALKFKKDGYLVMPDQKIEGPEDVAFAFQFLKDAAQEHFYIVPVKDGQALAAELITIGTYNTAQPAIYEILGLLDKTGADSVYMVHNHPNGRMEPSSDDMEFTTKAMGVLDKIKVKFSGHVIIDTDKFVFIKGNDKKQLTVDVIPHKQYARTRKVEVLKKYMEWTAGKESTPQVKSSHDIYEVIKGITVDPKSGIVVLLNNQMRIMNIYAMPQDKITANEIMRLSAKERTGSVITVNTGFDKLSATDIMADLNESGIKYLDDIDVVAPGKYASKQGRGLMEEPQPYQGKIAEDGPKDIAPEDQFDALTPEEQAQFSLEMDDLRKTPEGNLFIAIKRIGGIAPHRKGQLKEEYAEIPLFLKNNKGQPLDDFISQLQQYGWNFETEDQLIQEINRQAANPVEKVDRAGLRKIIRDAEKNKALKDKIARRLKNEKERRFIKTVREAPNTDPEVAKAVEGFYKKISNKESIEEAKALMANDREKAEWMVWKKGPISRIEATVAGLLLNEYALQGKREQAKALTEHVAKRATEGGQGIQALYIYERLSPEGILIVAERTIESARELLPKHKVEQFDKLAKDLKTDEDRGKLAKRLGIPHLSPELAKELTDAAKEIEAMPEGREKQIKTALMIRKITDQIPRTIWEKISMAQTIAQLLNPKTFMRNFLGNLVFQATENLADTIGTGMDIIMALNTKKRSVYLPNLKTQAKGAVQGFKEGYEEATLGIDLKGQTLSKFTLPKNGVFNEGVMGGLETTLRIALGATDRAFYQSAFNQSLEQQLKASGRKDPDEDMIERAHAIGLYRTFQDENILSRQFEQLKRWFNAGGQFGLGDIVLKYPRTPANLLHRGIEYSPFGFLHTVMRIADPLIFGKEFDQERFVRQTARAFTGSALLVGTGALLAALGIISGRRAKDKDIVETRRNSGIREYQINTSALKRFIMSGLDPAQAIMQPDDTLVNYDWMQPASIGIALGANMVLDPRSNLADKTINFADSMLQASETLQEQPLVRGVKTFTSRRNIAEGLSEVVKDMPASFVPTILNQVRQLTDNVARNTRDPNYLAEVGKKVAMRIPVASRALPAQITTLGEERQMYQDGSNNPFNVFLNPAFVSKYKPDPVSKMVLDIWNRSGNTEQFPRTAPRSIKVEGSTEPLVLGPEQYQLFASYIGNKTNVLFNMKANDPVFMALPDDQKAKKLQTYLTDIQQAAKIEVLGIRPAGTDRGTMYIIKQIKTDLEKIKANEEDGIDFEPYSDVPEGFK